MSEYGQQNVRRMIQEVEEKWHPLNKRRKSDKIAYKIQWAIGVLAVASIFMTVVAQIVIHYHLFK